MNKILYFSLIIFVLFISFISFFSSTDIGPLRTQSVQSGSMEPEISTGSLILLKSVPSYSVGEVITVERDEQNSLTHRIVEVEELVEKNIYKTKGDANKFADSIYIDDSMVMGKVIFMFPFLGKLVDYIKTDSGLGLLVVTPVAYIIFTELKSIKREVINGKTNKIII